MAGLASAELVGRMRTSGWMPAAAVGPGAVVELLRSLERMEADLAEMRSEVERMRRHLVSTPSLPVQQRPPR